ncbi:MAG: hypothetical protein WCB00_11355 [Candidatus Acidiferrales bacterium]
MIILPIRAIKWLFGSLGLIVVAGGIEERNPLDIALGMASCIILYGLGVLLERVILKVRAQQVMRPVAEPGQERLSGGRWRISARANKITLAVIGTIIGVLWFWNLVTR